MLYRDPMGSNRDENSIGKEGPKEEEVSIQGSVQIQVYDMLLEEEGKVVWSDGRLDHEVSE